MPKSTAWVLNLGGSQLAAVGARQMLHVIETPRLLEIPETPPHCRQVLIWEDNLLPVMDLRAWLGLADAAGAPAFAGITAYQEHPGAPARSGALFLAAMPTRIQVDDEHACELPEQPAGWQHLALSCFMHQGQAVPILNLTYIFSNALITDR